jgi:hypothetical protein
MAPRNTGPNRTLDILNSIAEQDFLGAEVVQNLRDQGLRVEQIAIGLIRPDAAQPRRVLPETIHQAFHNEEITPLQALKQYIEKVRIVARQHGRPFENLLDLLIDSENQDDNSELTPPEKTLRDLVNLAATLLQDGQVNPLTVVDHSRGATPLYIVETGERRYWANYLAMEFIPGYGGDGTISSIIIAPHQVSVFRQAKENTARAGLNAIAMARQAALLLLNVYDIHPPHQGPITNDFYRQALDLDLRSKREHTSEILLAMGGISRAYFSRYKKLLLLCDEAMEYADRHSLDEGVLRHVVDLPPETQLELVKQIADFHLTANQVKQLCNPESEEAIQEESFSKGARQMARLIQKSSKFDVQEVATLLLETGDKHMAWAQVQNLKQALVEVEQYLSQ